MKPAINDLVLLILDTILQVNAQGRWHGVFYSSAISSGVEVYFRPADFDYQAPVELQPHLEIHRAYGDASRYDSEQEQQSAFRSLLVFVQRHLAPTPVEPLLPAVSIFDVSTGTSEPLRDNSECSETERALREAVRLGHGSHHLPVDDIDTLRLELHSHLRGPMATLTANGGATLKLGLPADPQAAYERLVTSVQQFIAGYRAARDAA